MLGREGQNWTDSAEYSTEYDSSKQSRQGKKYRVEGLKTLGSSLEIKCLMCWTCSYVKGRGKAKSWKTRATTLLVTEPHRVENRNRSGYTEALVGSWLLDESHFTFPRFWDYTSCVAGWFSLGWHPCS